MLWKALFLWFVLMGLAILNGAVRVEFIIPAVGEATGHVVSTALLSTLILLTTWYCIGWIAPRSVRDAWMVGFLWLLMTLVFEFGVGYFISHRTWLEMLADYNLGKGRVWVFVPIITGLAPVLMAKLRGMIG